jgi:hypothetical protein
VRFGLGVLQAQLELLLGELERERGEPAAQV